MQLDITKKSSQNNHSTALSIVYIFLKYHIVSLMFHPKNEFWLLKDWILHCGRLNQVGGPEVYKDEIINSK